MGNRNKRQAVPTKGVNLITLIDRDSPISEQYRTIRTNIMFASSVDKNLKTLVVTSSGPLEGKSTSSANLAVVFANAGQRVLLVDADMRKPTVAKTFALDNSVGLSNLLTSHRDVQSLVQTSYVTNLSILPSGPKPPNPSELLASKRMEDLIKELEHFYDIIIFDMPPLLAVTDAQLIAAKVDGTILVIRERVSKKASAIKAKELLTMVNANVLGVVYNDTTSDAAQGYYYYGY